MPATYSINVGQPTESFRNQDINSVLLELPDNTQKLISPKDVRNAFLTAWANSAFNQTIGQAGIEYLGIDSGNPSNRDIKQKIFIGKRSYTGSDIMNNDLLTDMNNDIYFFNTKSDLSLQSTTKIVILSGTDSSLYNYSPSIQSSVINSGQSLSLDFVNPSLNGPINIYSNTGRVSINDIMFPTVAETIASASNGKILKYYGAYPNGVLKWADPSVTLTTIGSADSITNIYGSPSNVNGYSLEFVDDNIVPETIGGIAIGNSFSSGSFVGQNWPLSEVIRKLLYPYVPPFLTLNVTINGDVLITTGLTYSSLFDYSVYRYSNPIYEYQITGTTYSGLSFSGGVGSYISATFTHATYSNIPGTQSSILMVSDNTLLSFSHSATASIEFVHPSFYGFSSMNIPIDGTGTASLGAFINSSNRAAIRSNNSILLGYNGSGYMYFVVPFTYPLLNMIKDPNGFIIHDSTSLYSSFTYSSSTTPIGSNNLPIPVPEYRIYKTIITCDYAGSGYFEFIF